MVVVGGDGGGGGGYYIIDTSRTVDGARTTLISFRTGLNCYKTLTNESITDVNKLFHLGQGQCDLTYVIF